MKNLKSNKELLLLIQKDDKVAFYHLYERYFKRIFGFVLKYIKLKEDAEEIVQEVFVKIWESRKKIDIDTSFDSYLFTIAYNTTISMLRKRVNEDKYIQHVKSLQFLNKAPNLMDEIYFNELNNKILSLLNELTPRQREIFQLSREAGLSHEEIAIKLDISAATVKKHMANTLSSLKSKLGNHLIVLGLLSHLIFS